MNGMVLMPVDILLFYYDRSKPFYLFVFSGYCTWGQWFSLNNPYNIFEYDLYISVKSYETMF
jgi:hypothetical protein